MKCEKCGNEIHISEIQHNELGQYSVIEYKCKKCKMIYRYSLFDSYLELFLDNLDTFVDTVIKHK